MSRIRVAVLRGGPSSHHEASLKTGASVLRNLDSEKYIPVDIYIDKNDGWHAGGVPIASSDLTHRADVVWNALHGTYGEDGEVQQILESLRIPFTGSSAGVAGLSAHKAKAREAWKRWDIPTLPWTLVDLDTHTEDDMREIFRSIPQPLAVMSAHINTDVADSRSYGYHELMDEVLRAGERSPHVLIESRPRGRTAVCGVIDDFRGEKMYALIPVFVSDGAQSRLLPEEAQLIQDYARRAHDALGARHYSFSTFLVTPKNVYIIETRTSPDLHDESLFMKALDEIGCAPNGFLDHVIGEVRMA